MNIIEKTIRELFDLENMQPEKQAEMLERLAKLIFQGTLMKILPTLSENELHQYEKIIEEGQEQEVLFGFLRKAVPNFDKIVIEEAEELRVGLDDGYKNVGQANEQEGQAEFVEIDSKAVEIGMWIVGWIALAFWAVLGMFFWMPLLFRIVAAFCATLVYNMVIQNPAAIQKSRTSLELAINFYGRGFEVIRQTTSTNDVKKNIIANPVKEFDVISFIAQLAWTIIFWGILMLPFFWHKIKFIN
jgi:Protein of unknown function (DUF5663)